MSHVPGPFVHALPKPLTRLLAGACLAACALGASAAEYKLVYTGTFNNQDALNLASASSPTFFAGTTAYTITSYFSDTSPNLAPTFGGPFDGYRAYAPSSTTITIAGVTYSVEGAGADPLLGVTVSIFDQNSFTPGHYGVGLIANAPGDGAGIIGDFLSASPNFSASALTATTFTDYEGVGVGSGVCVPGTGSSPACQHVVTPWILTSSSNQVYSLTLGNYEEEYPADPLNTAQIIAVPEPSTYALLLAGLAGIGAVARRRAQRRSGVA